MNDAVPFPTIVLTRLAALGLDTGAILARAGIDHVELPRAKLTTAQFFALWDAVERAAPGRDFGLVLGAGAIAHRYDMASMVATHAANVRDALAKYAKYKHLICPEDVFVEAKGREARIRFHWTLADSEPPRMLVDGTFAAVHSLVRHGTRKDVRPIRLELARRKADVRLLEAHFGCPLVFDAPVDVFVLDVAALAEPFVTHDAALLAELVPGLDAELAREGRTLADEVRLALARRMCGERPSLGQVAADLRVSVRTLQRRLGEAGTSYQRLLDDVRADSARRLLARTNLEPSEVAFVLGFEEYNSFTRAFHAWEGTTPTKYRALAE